MQLTTHRRNLLEPTLSCLVLSAWSLIFGVVLWILRYAGGLASWLTLLDFPKRMASSPWGAVRPTPESGLLAEQVSTALVRSAGGQRHFRPPGARHFAPTAPRAPVGPQAAGLSDCVRCLFASYHLSPGSKQRQPRVVLLFSHATSVLIETSLLIWPPSCVAVGAPPHRTGQAFSPCGRVARTHGDRLVAFDSGDGTTRLPCGHVVARVRGARRAHVRTPWR